MFKNYESGAYGYIGFQKALEVSCNTFFYRIGFDFWQKYGTDVADVNAKDPLVEMAQKFGFGKKTGIDIPGEATGRIADRKWKRAYYESMKDYYCKVGEEPGSDFLHRFAREFCIEGFAYRAGDAVNFAIGQGDTVVTPLQLARAYAAIANGGTLYEPRVGKAIVSPEGKLIKEIEPKVQAELDIPGGDLEFIDTALQGVANDRHDGLAAHGLPARQGHVRAKTGSAEVYGKQSTSWVASYTKDYVVVMMVSQGGTGSGTSGPAIRKIYETLYGIKGDDGPPGRRRRSRASTPPATAAGLRRGRLDPAAVHRPRGGRAEPMSAPPAAPEPLRTDVEAASRAWPGCRRLDWMLLCATAALLAIGTLLVWSATAERDALTGGDPRRSCAGTWSTSRSAWCSRCSWPPPTTGGSGSSPRSSTSPR